VAPAAVGRGTADLLSGEEIEDGLPAGWDREGEEIVRTHEFDESLDGIGFAPGAGLPQPRLCPPFTRSGSVYSSVRRTVGYVTGAIPSTPAVACGRRVGGARGLLRRRGR